MVLNLKTTSLPLFCGTLCQYVLCIKALASNCHSLLDVAVAKLSLIVKLSELLLFLPSVFRHGSVATRNGQQRYFCRQKEPFAFLVTGSYAQVSYYFDHYYKMTFKAFYFTMNNGKLPVRLIELW